MTTPMYGFREPLDVRLMPDGKWMLLQDLTYLCRLTQKAYTAPAGTVTDFASVPRLPIVYLLFGNVATLAAVIHDHLYQTAEEPKPVADQVFEEIMELTGVPEWRRKFMELGVQVGGKAYEMQDDGTVVKTSTSQRNRLYEITSSLGSIATRWLHVLTRKDHG